MTKSVDPPSVVYLDQNKWIALARVWYGKCDSSVDGATLTALLKMAEDDSAVFPLSLGHYMETWKNADMGRRRRLAEFMVKLSSLTTMAPIQSIVRHELEIALSSHFPGRIQVAAFELLGKFLAHATGNPGHSLDLEWPTSTAVSDAERNALSALMKLQTELTFLGRAWPAWLPDKLPELPGVDLRDLDLRFNEGLRDWISKTEGMSDAELEYEIRRITFADVASVAEEVLKDHSISTSEFNELPEETKSSLVRSLPSRAIDMHLRREFKRNKTLKIQASDLNDWAFVGAAAAYVDIVVTERQMTHVLKTAGAGTKAEVISRLDDLPELLSG